MIITVNPEWHKYIKESFDDEKTRAVHTVSLSNTPDEVLKEMRKLDKSFTRVKGYPYFTYVE